MQIFEHYRVPQQDTYNIHITTTYEQGHPKIHYHHCHDQNYTNKEHLSSCIKQGIKFFAKKFFALEMRETIKKLTEKDLACYKKKFRNSDYDDLQRKYKEAETKFYRQATKASERALISVEWPHKKSSVYGSSTCREHQPLQDKFDRVNASPRPTTKFVEDVIPNEKALPQSSRIPFRVLPPLLSSPSSLHSISPSTDGSTSTQTTEEQEELSSMNSSSLNSSEQKKWSVLTPPINIPLNQMLPLASSLPQALLTTAKIVHTHKSRTSHPKISYCQETNTILIAHAHGVYAKSCPYSYETLNRVLKNCTELLSKDPITKEIREAIQNEHLRIQQYITRYPKQGINIYSSIIKV